MRCLTHMGMFQLHPFFDSFITGFYKYWRGRCPFVLNELNFVFVETRHALSLEVIAQNHITKYAFGTENCNISLRIAFFSTQLSFFSIRIVFFSIALPLFSTQLPVFSTRIAFFSIALPLFSTRLPLFSMELPFSVPRSLFSSHPPPISLCWRGFAID